MPLIPRCSIRPDAAFRMAVTVACVCLSVVAIFPTTVSAEEPEAAWRDLLPNQSLSLWKTTGNWTIDKNGVVTLTPRPGESGWKRYGAYLWLDEQFTDFEIQFEYTLEPKGNSGFYFHVADTADPVQQGIEVQIYDSYGQQKLNDHTSGGVIPGVAPTAQAAKPAGEWNRFDITVRGNTLKVVLNGELINTVDLEAGRLAGRPQTGAIGFQDHGLPLALRNIRIRKL